MARTALLSLLSGFVVFLWGGDVRSEDHTRPSREASVDSEDVLKRFISELVHVVPGKDKFPESVKTPSAELRLDSSIRISRYETTQELYQTVMGRNPSRWQGPRNSVESISRQDVKQFCDRLQKALQQRRLIDEFHVVRLPTDIEWEYCCRAGSVKPFCFGALADAPGTLDQYAWHTGNAAGNDPAVGVLLPNLFGLYDTHGYLWEFVDSSSSDQKAENSDGEKPIVRAMGGSWRDPAALLAADSRIPVPEYAVSDAIGFRCVVSKSSTKPKKPSSR